MIPEDIFLKIVRCAIKAPSGHNIQPWLFSREEDTICIMPDFRRSLPVADPELRELFISLGCAAETTMIAARFYGYYPALNIDSLNNLCTIKITLQRDDTAEQPELFSYINTRQTTRTLFDNKLIPEADLITLKQTVTDSDVGLRLYTAEAEIRMLAPYIIEANNVQMSNPDFRNELIHWMRFSEKEALKRGDGLYTACIGVPSLGRIMGSFVLKKFVTHSSEEKRILRQLEKTASVAIFTAQSNDLEHWIKTGMALQRFALTATKLGISHSLLNSPCQINCVRDKLMNEIGSEGIPMVILRLGYSEKMHFSFRRRINEVITG